MRHDHFQLQQPYDELELQQQYNAAMSYEDSQDVSFSSVQRPLVPRLTVPNSLSNTNEDHQFDSPTTLSVPRVRGRSRTFSQVASPFKSNNAVGEGLSIAENKHGGAGKALEESRKLLSHILNELANRPRAPSVWSEFKNGHQDSKKGGSSIARHGSGDKAFKAKEMAMRTFSLPDSEDEDELLFSPDIAYDLLSKLRDILLIAHTHNWHIFDDR